MTAQLEPTTLTVADADAAVATAEQERADLEGRIRRGDPTVTPDDLAAADAAVRFASLRLGLAEQQATERAEAERQAQIAALRSRAVDLANDQRVTKARQAMERAVDAYVAACRAYDLDYSDVYDALSRLDPHAVMPGTGISVGGQMARPAYPQQDISRAARTALRQHYPRVQVDLNRS